MKDARGGTNLKLLCGHYLGLAFFGFEATHTDRVPVYCSPEMAEYLASNGPWDQLVRIQNIALRPVADGENIELHPELSAVPVAVPHRDEYADTVGFILRGPRRSMLYVPDTDGWERWQPPLTEMLDGIDIAILDGTFFSLDELPGRDISAIGHPLIESSMDLLEQMVDDEILDRLTTVRGVGRWTVEMLLIFHLGRPDVLPSTDLGVRKGFQLTYGLEIVPKPSDILEYGELWRPFRTAASWYLWRRLDSFEAGPLD